MEILILSSRQTKTDTCINSVDPDETARLIWIYTVCHYVFDFRLKSLFAFSGHVQIQGWKSRLQKFEDERLKLYVQDNCFLDTF